MGSLYNMTAFDQEDSVTYKEWVEKQVRYVPLSGEYIWKVVRAECRLQCNELQAKVDRLMLEYCPEEMTTEQLAEWEVNQKSSFTEREAWQTKHEVDQRSRYAAWKRDTDRDRNRKLDWDAEEEK